MIAVIPQIQPIILISGLEFRVIYSLSTPLPFATTVYWQWHHTGISHNFLSWTGRCAYLSENN